jgi:hypothetical protein
VDPDLGQRCGSLTCLLACPFGGPNRGRSLMPNPPHAEHRPSLRLHVFHGRAPGRCVPPSRGPFRRAPCGEARASCRAHRADPPLPFSFARFARRRGHHLRGRSVSFFRLLLAVAPPPGGPCFCTVAHRSTFPRVHLLFPSRVSVHLPTPIGPRPSSAWSLDSTLHTDTTQARTRPRRLRTSATRRRPASC